MEERLGDPDYKEDLSREMPSMRKFRGRRGKTGNPVREGKVKAVGLGFFSFLQKIFKNPKSVSKRKAIVILFIEGESRSPTKTGETGKIDREREKAVPREERDRKNNQKWPPDGLEKIVPRS